MKHAIKLSWLLIILALVSLAACGPRSTPTADTAPIFTQIAATALAMQAQTEEAIPTATETPPPTKTPEPTVTPLITSTPTSNAPATTPKPTSQASCDNMEGIADVTIPDGYTAAPGEVMTKTWKIKNLGPCTWDQDYSLIFAYGGENTNWSKTKPARLEYVVQPGQTVEISVILTAPTTSGEYGAYFRMQNNKGVNFGNTVWIYIKVK